MKRPYEPTRTVLTILFTVTLALAAARAVDAQEREGPPPEGQAIVEIEHTDPGDVAEVIRVFGVIATPNRDLGLVTIRGPRDAVDAARAAAVQLDRPPEPTPSIQVTAYVLDASKVEPLDGGVPPALAEVADQLREVFGFRGVELIDSLALRALDGGGGQVTGSLPASGERGVMPYRLGFNRAEVIHGERTSVRLEGFSFHTTTQPDPEAAGEDAESRGDATRLITDLEVRTGQKAVVGKAASASARGGLILVVEVAVLE
ncbi:MAG: hypothetical protein PVG07_10920 [Acidobacteriota bacterium]|jgi:hypothetical protein